MPQIPCFRLQPAPNREPPFDDEPASGRSGLAGSRDQQLPFVVAEAAAPRFRPLGRAGEPEPRDQLPEPGRFARRFAIAVIEAATGRRTAGQLSNYTSPGVQAGLVRDAGRINRLGTAARPASLHSMHVVEPADGVVEAAAIVRVETRYRAIAFRLEGVNGRWRCVRLQIG
ncbi:MAG TPA: Rv3235 family protein [Jatrophihabitans sp.]|nr:Rv3235 family protein [Jatrophihabitans sp.]